MIIKKLVKLENFCACTKMKKKKTAIISKQKENTLQTLRKRKVEEHLQPSGTLIL